MFEQVEAVRFDRKMANGRTSPLLLECEQDDGSTVEVVAKFSKLCSVGGLVREAMVAMLATDLGLPVPAPFLVQISAEFIDSIPDAAVANLLRESDAFGFGSRRLPDGYGQWTEPGGRMSDEMEQEATDIMALDCWLTNSDRRATNPNLLTNGRQFAIFDHELALIPSLFGWAEPWKDNALAGAKPPGDHVFFEHLRGRSSYLTDEVRESLAELKDARITEYVAALPPSWVAFENVASDARTYIKALRDNAQGADKELKRALV